MIVYEIHIISAWSNTDIHIHTIPLCLSSSLTCFTRTNRWHLRCAHSKRLCRTTPVSGIVAIGPSIPWAHAGPPRQGWHVDLVSPIFRVAVRRWQGVLKWHMVAICRPLLDMLLVVVLSPAVMMLFIYLTWRLRQRQRRKNELAPSDFVTKLPTRKFKREKHLEPQEDDHPECAICLEDYVDDDTLRTLPCRHEFHAHCVDAWLTTHKKFVSQLHIYIYTHITLLSVQTHRTHLCIHKCPICKHDICCKPPSNERTPLLNAWKSQQQSTTTQQHPPRTRHHG